MAVVGWGKEASVAADPCARPRAGRECRVPAKLGERSAEYRITIGVLGVPIQLAERTEATTHALERRSTGQPRQSWAARRKLPYTRWHDGRQHVAPRDAESQQLAPS